MNPQQAVWQHFHFAQSQTSDKKMHISGASADPVKHRALYQRLQNMGRQNTQKVATFDNPEQVSKWQAVAIKDDEKEVLGLSEL